MNNQTFTSYSTPTEILLRKVEFANEIIQQATKWHSEAIGLQNEADTVSAGEIIAETAKLVWDIYCIWTDDDYYYYNDD